MRATDRSDGRLARPSELVRNATGIAAEQIRQAIFEGKFQPGDRLKEEQLARDLGISRTPIREALLVLQTEGLVGAMPNRGSVVREFSASAIGDLYDIRSVLEAHAAHRAAKQATSQTVAQLEASNKRFSILLRRGDIFAMVEENVVFHRIVIDSAESPTLSSLLQSVTRLPLIYRAYSWYSEKEKRDARRYHREITSAMRAHAPSRAERLMRAHILEARSVLIRHLERKASSG